MIKKHHQHLRQRKLGSGPKSVAWGKHSSPFHTTLPQVSNLSAFSPAPLNSYDSMPRLFFLKYTSGHLIFHLNFWNSVCRMKCKLFGLTHKILKVKVPTFIILSLTPPFCALNIFVKMNKFQYLRYLSHFYLSVFAYAIPLAWKRDLFIHWLSNSNRNHWAKPS